MASKRMIRSTGSILIQRKVEEVFRFFADPTNDPQWRTEVTRTTRTGEPGAGTTVQEHSYLSKKAPDVVVELRCVQYEENERAIFETPDGAPSHRRSERRVSARPDGTTEVVYTLAFDTAIVKEALGFALPRYIVALKAGHDLKRYLRRLKAVLERGQAA